MLSKLLGYKRQQAQQELNGMMLLHWLIANSDELSENSDTTDKPSDKK